MSAKTRRSSAGLYNAWRAPDARPFSKSSHQTDNTKPVPTASTIGGRNKVANGAVIRRVTSGLETTSRQRSARSGFDFFTAGSEPSGCRRTPSGRSLASARKRTSSTPASLPMLRLTSVAISG
jgi:hypothetical protein